MLRSPLPQSCKGVVSALYLNGMGQWELGGGREWDTGESRTYHADADYSVVTVDKVGGVGPVVRVVGDILRECIKCSLVGDLDTRES